VRAGTVALGAGGDAGARVPGPRLVMRQRHDLLAGGHRRQPGLLLRLAAAARQRLGPQQQRAQEGLRHQPAAQRLEHRGQLGQAHLRSAEALGQQDAHPAELRHLLPEVARESRGVVGVPQRAQPRHRRVAVREVRGGLGQEILVFALYELHESGLRGRTARPVYAGASGRPRIFSKMI